MQRNEPNIYRNIQLVNLNMMDALSRLLTQMNELCMTAHNLAQEASQHYSNIQPYFTVL
jgi:hypothetical protein